jgi:hypothetical protein
VLTLQDVALLREALAYWAIHEAGLELTDGVGTENDECSTEVEEGNLVALYDLLTPEHVRFIVVDGDTNHAINTRLFRRIPRLHPVAGRWQVRTVIG